ncbi:hypothetical protein HG535_0F02140 [Zygotorulaspora mrakii]|uniref:Bax inhibitor 1 n=1 Tax=Zygotorulaspora mrakii TaxID=42260 RepID=A0A7H9B5G3_ZYGMR|nr:uncharacterized protein HG535_0F02140 [Zygotorulaspora mrakii]QLG73703.1 hypothetical protein HG535_0F02140 [Zygotorulaspora mrakii]
MSKVNQPPPYQEYESLNHDHNVQVPVEQRRSNVPEDFKYSVTISACEFEIRQKFMAKVYSILSVQLLTTLVFSMLALRSKGLQLFIVNHMGLYILGIIVSLVTCLWIAWAPRRELYEMENEISDPLVAGPSNGTSARSENIPWYCLSKRGQYILLSLFTISEAYCLGSSIMFVPQDIVMNAIVVTTVVVIGVTLMALSGKFEIALESAMSIYYWLNLALLVMIGIGISFLFMGGMGSKMNLFYGWIGAIVFTVYLFIDTQLIFRQMFIGEEIKCALSLYLDIINLFLSILRIMQSSDDN